MATPKAKLVGGSDAKDVTLDAEIFGADVKPHLVHETVRAELERFGSELGLEAYVQHENIFVATSEPTPVRVAPLPALQHPLPCLVRLPIRPLLLPRPGAHSKLRIYG